MKRFRLFLLMTILLISCGRQALGDTPSEDSVTLAVGAEGPELVESSGQARFRIPEGGSWSFTWEPGYPRLPVKKVWLLLPPDAVLESLSLTAVPGTLITEKPGCEFEFTQIPGHETVRAAEDQDKPWPDGWARIAAAGQFRKYRYALVEVCAYRYDFEAGAIVRTSSVLLEVKFDRTGRPRGQTDSSSEEWSAGSMPDFANSSQYERDYSTPADRACSAQAPVDYLIITTDVIPSLPEFSDFVALKESQGLSVEVVTMDEITVSPGPDPADQIRSYLQANYIDWGLKYLLLIGTPNPDDPKYDDDPVGTVPMKLCFPQSYWTDRPDDEIEAATDYYYADLTGNWDADGDGLYGEAFSLF
jgi:hypothetical protein